MLKNQKMVFINKETGAKFQTWFVVSAPSDEYVTNVLPTPELLQAWFDEQILAARLIGENAGYTFLEIEPWVYEYGEDRLVVRRTQEGSSQLWSPNGWVEER
jgi:hypothetical protein